MLEGEGGGQPEHSGWSRTRGEGGMHVKVVYSEHNMPGGYLTGFGIIMLLCDTLARLNEPCFECITNWTDKETNQDSHTCIMLVGGYILAPQSTN